MKLLAVLILGIAAGVIGDRWIYPPKAQPMLPPGEYHCYEIKTRGYRFVRVP